MLNKEKFENEILDIVCNGNYIAVVNGKPTECNETTCENCIFNERCNSTNLKEWMNNEYVEPVEPSVDWKKIPVDTPILVKATEKCAWIHRYFAKYENGLVYAWERGATSWSTEDSNDVCDWQFAKLATKTDKEGE